VLPVFAFKLHYFTKNDNTNALNIHTHAASVV